MSEEIKGVEAKTEAAPAQQEVDYEAVLKQKDQELEQVRGERENYRKGMLKAKGKLPEEDYTDDNRPEDWREETRRIAREEYLSTQESRLQAEKEAATRALIKQNSELKVALQNRGQISTSSAAGSNEDRPEVKTDSYFSKDQVSALKAKGWSDEKIEQAKKNMLKSSQSPKI